MLVAVRGPALPWRLIAINQADRTERNTVSATKATDVAVLLPSRQALIGMFLAMMLLPPSLRIRFRIP